MLHPLEPRDLHLGDLHLVFHPEAAREVALQEAANEAILPEEVREDVSPQQHRLDVVTRPVRDHHRLPRLVLRRACAVNNEGMTRRVNRTANPETIVDTIRRIFASG